MTTAQKTAAAETATRPRRSDEEVIRACLAGSQAAWNELVDRYSRLVYSVPRRLDLSAADAEEVFQEVFIIVFRKLKTLRDVARLAPWLIRIAHRESFRVLRHRGQSLALQERLADGRETPPEQLAARERAQRVRAALRALGEPHQRLIVELVSAPRPDYARVAARLGIKIGSIGPTRARCLRKLQRLLGEDRVAGAPAAPQPAA